MKPRRPSHRSCLGHPLLGPGEGCLALFKLLPLDISNFPCVFGVHPTPGELSRLAERVQPGPVSGWCGKGRLQTYVADASSISLVCCLIETLPGPVRVSSASMKRTDDRCAYLISNFRT